MRYAKLWFVPFVCLVASACQQPGVKPPIQPRVDPYPPNQINIADEDLRRQTAVGEPNLTRDPAGILYVSLPIRATTDLTLYVDYRATFFGPQGQTLSPTSWIRKTLHPNVPDRIEVNSTSAQAANFQIDLRYSQ